MKPTHLTDTVLEHILDRNLNKRPLDRANLTVGTMRSLITELLTVRLEVRIALGADAKSDENKQLSQGEQR